MITINTLSIFFQFSVSFVSALIFIISLLVLFLGLACSCFSISLSYKVRLLISDLSDLLLCLFLNL